MTELPAAFKANFGDRYYPSRYITFGFRGVRNLAEAANCLAVAVADRRCLELRVFRDILPVRYVPRSDLRSVARGASL